MSHIQSILVDKEKYKKGEANRLIKKLGYKTSFHGKPVDVTENFYRYRQQEPESEKYKYRSKKTEKGITFIIGFPKGQKGVGAIIPDLRNHASPAIRKFLKENGDETITHMQVGRMPIKSWVDRISNWLTLGKWEENKKRLSYDKMFHLFLQMQLSNGKNIYIEKNQVPVIVEQTNYAQVYDQENLSVKAPKVTFAEFMANGEKNAGSPENFWVYDPIYHNCQDFIKNLLQGNSSWFPEVKDFVEQDAVGVVEGAPWFHAIAKAVTDVANRADVLINGKGKFTTMPVRQKQIGSSILDTLNHKYKGLPGHLRSLYLRTPGPWTPPTDSVGSVRKI